MNIRQAQVAGRPKVVRTPGGTAEAIARREFLAKRDREAKTGYPLGIMLVNEIIDDAQHDAGCKYAALYAHRFGPITLKCSMEAILKDRGGYREDGRDIAYPKRLLAAKTALMVLGIETVNIVENICVFMKCPAWLGPHRPNVQDVREATAVYEGLSLLAKHFSA